MASGEYADCSVLTAMYSLEFDKLVAVARWCGAGDEAADVVQAVFLTLLSRAAQGKYAPADPGALWRYVRRCIKSEAAHQSRARYRQMDNLRAQVWWPGTRAWWPGTEPGSDPADAVGHLAERQTVIEDAARLSPRQRQVISLAADGYTPAEIATRLGTTANSVRVHLCHARERLRAELGPRHTAQLAA
jgi:RNA polymerase sigma factor (sigma-70 family)